MPERCQQRSIPRRTSPSTGVVRTAGPPCDPPGWSVRHTVMLAEGRDRSAHQQCTGRVHGIQLKSDSGISHRVIPSYHSSDYGIVIGANGNGRGKKVTSLARWPPNPSRCWALTWRTIGPMEDYWARSGGLLAEWPLPPRAECFHSLA